MNYFYVKKKTLSLFICISIMAMPQTAHSIDVQNTIHNTCRIGAGLSGVTLLITHFLKKDAESKYNTLVRDTRKNPHILKHASADEIKSLKKRILLLKRIRNIAIGALGIGAIGALSCRPSIEESTFRTSTDKNEQTSELEITHYSSSTSTNNTQNESLTQRQQHQTTRQNSSAIGSQTGLTPSEHIKAFFGTNIFKGNKLTASDENHLSQLLLRLEPEVHSAYLPILKKIYEKGPQCFYEDQRALDLYHRAPTGIKDIFETLLISMANSMQSAGEQYRELRNIHTQSIKNDCVFKLPEKECQRLETMLYNRVYSVFLKEPLSLICDKDKEYVSDALRLLLEKGIREAIPMNQMFYIRDAIELVCEDPFNEKNLKRLNDQIEHSASLKGTTALEDAKQLFQLFKQLKKDIFNSEDAIAKAIFQATAIKDEFRRTKANPLREAFVKALDNFILVLTKHIKIDKNLSEIEKRRTSRGTNKTSRREIKHIQKLMEDILPSYKHLAVEANTPILDYHIQFHKEKIENIIKFLTESDEFKIAFVRSGDINMDITKQKNKKYIDQSKILLDSALTIFRKNPQSPQRKIIQKRISELRIQIKTFEWVFAFMHPCQGCGNTDSPIVRAQHRETEEKTHRCIECLTKTGSSYECMEMFNKYTTPYMESRLEDYALRSIARRLIELMQSSLNEAVFHEKVLLDKTLNVYMSLITPKNITSRAYPISQQMLNQRQQILNGILPPHRQEMINEVIRRRPDLINSRQLRTALNALNMLSTSRFIIFLPPQP